MSQQYRYWFLIKNPIGAPQRIEVVAPTPYEASMLAKALHHDNLLTGPNKVNE